MKKLLIAASALFFLAGSATAQSDTAKVKKHQRGHFARHKSGKGFQKLNLSEEQKKQFKTQSEAFRKQAKELRDNSSLSAEEKKTKLKALRKEQFEKTQSLFTAEQKAQMAANRKTAGEKGFKKAGRGGRNFDRTKGMEQMKTRLGLTDEQSAKLKTSQQGFREKMKALHSDDKLSREQKKEQMKTLAKEQRESMKAILTPEQLEKLKSGRKNKTGSK